MASSDQDIADAVRQALADPAFAHVARPASWSERLGDWLSEILTKLLGSGLAVDFITALIYALGLAGIIFVIYLIVSAIGKISKSSASKSPKVELQGETLPAKAWQELLSRARSALDAAELASSASLLEQACVAYAVEQDWLEASDWKTHGRYLRECGGTDSFRELFASVTQNFEAAMFAAHVPDAPVLGALIESARQQFEEGVTS